MSSARIPSAGTAGGPAREMNHPPVEATPRDFVPGRPLSGLPNETTHQDWDKSNMTALGVETGIGPQGPPGPAGDKGDQGDPGPAGPHEAVDGTPFVSATIALAPLTDGGTAGELVFKDGGLVSWVDPT